MIDPFPGSADDTLEARLRVLFRGISTKEPEREGIWFDISTRQLCVKVSGQVVRFNPAP